MRQDGYKNTKTWLAARLGCRANEKPKENTARNPVAAEPAGAESASAVAERNRAVGPIVGSQELILIL